MYNNTEKQHIYTILRAFILDNLMPIKDFKYLSLATVYSLLSGYSTESNIESECAYSVVDPTISL